MYIHNLLDPNLYIYMLSRSVRFASLYKFQSKRRTNTDPLNILEVQ